MTDSNEQEFVDKNHPYMTDHDLSSFTWEFDGQAATRFAGDLISQVIAHTLECGPEHAIQDFSVQAGLTLDDVPKDTQLPVLMLNDGEGNVPVAVLLIDKDRLPLAHTLGTLVTEDGVHPALPSRMMEAFDEPDIEDPGVTQEDDSE